MYLYYVCFQIQITKLLIVDNNHHHQTPKWHTAAIDIIGEDNLQNIFSRLPATSFASAAHGTSSANASFLVRSSVNHSLQDAVEEVVNKVLSQPIRPHFAIAAIGDVFSSQLDSFEGRDEEDVLEQARHLITTKLGSQVPFITNDVSGLIGRDALSDEFKEFQDSDIIMLTVGYLPGMKVTAIPLFENNKHMIDKFVTDIREFSTSVSGRDSPAAIIMFGDDYDSSMEGVVEKMDYAFSPETVIAGDTLSNFRYTNNTHAAVALVFAVDMNKRSGIGETQFNAVVSSGLSPVGPTYEAASVVITKYYKYCKATSISARREGSHENIDSETLLNQVYDELGECNRRCDLYIGVTRKRECSIGQEKVGCMTSLAFHSVNKSWTRQGYLLVFSEDIKTGDTFRFYYPSGAGLSSVSSHLRSFNQRGNNTDKHEVFGGLIFISGDNSFGQSNICNSPFLDNFPGMTLGGTFCYYVTGRGVLTPYSKESQGQKTVRICVDRNGIVFLIMSYTP